MEPVAERLVMYGAPATAEGLEWSWVDDQLRNAGAYWVVVPGPGHPHPRPVWGVWERGGLFLSIGSPRIRTQAEIGAAATIHLGDVNDVVVVEGRVAGPVVEQDLIDVYNGKYDWDYSVDEYGPLTHIHPIKAIAWRSTGWAGRGGFESTGRWTFPPKSA